VTRVAEAAGIHRTTLHRMLNPANKPSFSSMVKVLKACELNLLVEKRNGV